MVECIDDDHIVAVVGKHTVELQLPDGTKVDVGKIFIARSSLLQQTISESDFAASLSIKLPRGVLQTWLDFDAALQRDFADVGTPPDEGEVQVAALMTAYHPRLPQGVASVR